MQLIDITDSKDTHHHISFGIDLGTTNSLIAMVDNNGHTIIFEDKNNQSLIPSIVNYNNNCITVGCDADKNHTSTLYSIKRLMGKNISDIQNSKLPFKIVESNNDLHLIVDNRTVTPVEVSSEILKKLCNIVKNKIGVTVKKAVITVPAYFDDIARKATKDAARIAGIEILRLLNEPTASALAYSIQQTDTQGIYVVYDLGGGTFDISVLKLHKGVFQVLATGGDTNLGGDDIDYSLAEFIFHKYQNTYSTNIILDKKSFSNLVLEAQKVKIFLSENDYGHFVFNIQDKLFKCKITQQEFNSIITPLINKTLQIVKDTLASADINCNNISKVLLVGGSTKSPIIKNMLNDLFPNKVFDNVNPDKVVVSGAALQAYYLSNPHINNKNILIDVLPLSLGLETMGGIVEKIIPRNTPIPTSATQEFTTYVDGQTSMQIHICQGEREMIFQNKSLAKFNLQNIPPLPAGQAKIKVEFSVDADGLLTVLAQEKSTGVSKHIEIQSTYDLTNQEIEQCISESLENFDQDMQLRYLSEVKIKGENIIRIIENTLTKNKDLAETSEIKLISDAIKDLQHALLSNNINNIENAINNLELKSSNLIQKKNDFLFKKFY
ncbi:Fe-S protein assembly chaperone HscA [Candidatus Neoehrlichia procyonis]|uniref:Fe-S protein assembly chaperone HscA n=1 Tax=Candidatus Neoehrlichia procyonis str. RAC413 TaxID=1359163 RepID=A0A0F3NLA2_9RICK|nr:Fe-S protein assembly chaperone HscA [Candidatus Neoehrlichia lotoris]KJV68815.1 fe-S protein assembly chaperone HscA [Candidatus Neoehrlichia lotoris str. RAC413]